MDLLFDNIVIFGGYNNEGYLASDIISLGLKYISSETGGGNSGEYQQPDIYKNHTTLEDDNSQVDEETPNNPYNNDTSKFKQPKSKMIL